MININIYNHSARNPRACNISGKTITDGQTYQPNCSLMCTCQDGKYACSSLCPQELRPPSPTYCRDAQLVTVKAQCCKEWVCPNPHNYPSLEDTLSSQYREYWCYFSNSTWLLRATWCNLDATLVLLRVTSRRSVRNPLLIIFIRFYYPKYWINSWLISKIFYS